MHLLASEMFQLSYQAWQQPLSFMGELYFAAALQRRPDQNTDPKMEVKVCSPFLFWPRAFCRHMVVDNYQHRLVTIYIFCISDFSEKFGIYS